MKILSKRTLLILIGFALSSSTAFADFSDVPSTHPNFEAINYIQAQKIVEGYPDGTFRPDHLMNRAEFTKIIMEAFYQGQSKGDGCFSDIGTQWFAKYVCYGKILNFINGYPDGSFKPADNINFVEGAKILINAKGLTVTPDATSWYKPYVEKLAENHAVPLSITSFSQKLTRGEMAEMIYQLRANIPDKPSKTYEELVVQNAQLPVRIKIPGINVDAAIEYAGLTSDGSVGIPTNPNNAAWFDVGPRPGDIGSAIITGHVNWYYGAKGVFENLYKLKPGDKVIIQDGQGTDISFAVREIRNYDAAANAVDVFNLNDEKAHLNLITCEGVWIKSAKQYSQRLVIFTDREAQ